MRRAELPDPSLWEIAEAGGPILADESVDDVIPLPKQLVGEGTFLMLSVVGESMINAAITGGDWVVVRRDSDVENGDIVAALVKSETGREVTVRTFKEIDGHVWLLPHNPVYPPVMADDAVIIGKVVTVLRRM
jgi:repressor LexA